MILLLIYKFVEETKDGILYLYYPEGKQSAPGKVCLIKKGEGAIVEESREDFGGYYAYHAIRGIELTKKTGTIAWY